MYSDRFSLLTLPLILCAVPFVLMLVSWQMGNSSAATLPRPRRIAFLFAVSAGLLSVMGTMTCYIDPYPLIHYADGSEGIGWLDLAWNVSALACVLSVALAMFARGRARVLLIVSDLLVLLLWFGSVLQNGV